VLNRVLEYTQSVVDDARVPHGSESMCRADARNAKTFSPLTPRHRLSGSDLWATVYRSDAGLTPRQDCLLRGHGSSE
jgi:hypothetical protein